MAKATKHKVSSSHLDSDQQDLAEKLDIVSSQDLPIKLLDKINLPSDLKSYSDEELKEIAAQLRQETISCVSKTGGHLGAGLGVVELSLAIHAVFDTPKDKLIWDVGHQCYPHKILTGRKDKMHGLRQKDGLSGFTKRAESEFDPFGAAHSSTSISAGLGMAVARDLKKDDNNIICVIGDGAMSAGMAYEAVNNAGAMKSRLIVILNDNEMSIAPPVGAMSRYLTKLVSSKPYISARELGKRLTEKLPSPIRHVAKRAEEGARMSLSSQMHNGGSFFEEMGFYYIGPVDGHNLDHLLPILRNVKEAEREGPILIHAITQKGKGYLPAENSKDKMHGVKKFNVVTGDQAQSKKGPPSYTKVFAQSLIKEARKDPKIVGITAAMPDGTGIDIFQKEFPERAFDVGIAEQHAVTFAAGLAAEGFKPFAAIYSTFLQRAYDQIVHDVAIQGLPVKFAIDRAGLVGADGQTHAGSFDITYLGCLPHFVLMAASNEDELQNMVKTAAAYNDGPIAFRYPRGEGTGCILPPEASILEIGKGRIVEKGDNVAILSYGGRLSEAQKARELLKQHGLNITIADARFAKPLDKDLIAQLATDHDVLISIEEGSLGGFGSYVLDFLNQERYLHDVVYRSMHLPDYFQDQASPEQQYQEAGLCVDSIVKLVCSLAKNIKD